MCQLEDTMVDKKKLISKIENDLYSIKDKYEADDIITNYIRLINFIDLTDYKIFFNFEQELKIFIKHKAFNTKVPIYFINNDLFINNLPTNLEEINKILPTFFELDKKEEKD